MKSLLLFLLFIPRVFAQSEISGTAGLAAESNDGKLAVGNAVTVRVYVEKALDESGWSLSQPDQSGWIDAGPVLLKKNSLKASVDSASTKFDIAGVLAKPGNGEVKDLLLTNGTLTVRAAGNLGQIGSLLTDEEKKKQPQWLLPTVPYGGWNVWLISVLAILALSVLGYAGYLFWKKRKASSSAGLNYFERAVLDLRDLERQIKKTDRESQRRIGYALAKIVREFSEGRFGIAATEMTDIEFTKAITNNSGVKKRFSEIDTTFASLDLLRYSKADLDPTVASKIFLDVRDFVLGNEPPKEEPKR
jgi:hypothetical protein